MVINWAYNSYPMIQDCADIFMSGDINCRRQNVDGYMCGLFLSLRAPNDTFFEKNVSYQLLSADALKS